MAEWKPCMTPMEEWLKLTKASTAAKVDATLYQSIISGLRYLVHMRPDIAFAMGYVSRFMEDPREDHWAAVKRPLHYVKGTVDQGIIFPKTGESRLQLIVFSDANMAGDIDGRRSTSGVLVFLGSAPISWLTLKQKVVRAIYVRGRVRSGGHSGVPSCVAAPTARRADRYGSSPTSTNGGQPARHRPREESGSV